MKIRNLLINQIIIAFFMLITNVLFAQSRVRDFPYNNPFFGFTNNFEHQQLSSSFELTQNLYCMDSIIIDSLSYQLPHNWTANVATNIIGQLYTPCDSIILSIYLTIPDTVNLPYYPQDFQLKIFYHLKDSANSYTTIAAKIYFTPYNTIEIWNLEDYYSLPRRWINQDDFPGKTRVYIPSDSIPESNITDFSLYMRDSSNWNDWWVDNFREVEIDGLAYTILMKPVPEDSLLYYKDFDDSPIKYATGGRKKFTGTVKGRITTTVENGFGSPTFGLAGIRVRLMEKDAIYDEPFGETFTDENGYYSITYSKSQSILEGSEIELYLKLYAEDNGVYQIRSISNTIVHRERYELCSCGTNAGTIIKDIDLFKKAKSTNDAFRAVHWVRKAYKYFTQESVYLSPNVKIKINAMGSWANVYTVDIPVIHLETGDGSLEDVTRHEFGHCIMYKLQNNNMKIPYGEEGVNAHSWTKENTGLLAWIEGWANAIEMILDAAYYVEDNEYGKSRFSEYYEIKPPSTYVNNINNGYRSEYYIARAIYDLWDGPNKGLPNTMPTDPSVHGWNDYGSWNSIDNVEFSLAQICAPLQMINTPADMENLRNIGHYYNSFLSQFTDCKDKADISRTFLENRVIWNIDDFINGISIGNLSSDELFVIKNKSEQGTIRVEIPFSTVSWTDTYKVNKLNENSIQDYYFYACPNTSLALTDNYWIGVYQNGCNRVTNLYLNNGYNYTCGNATVGYFYTCGGNQMLIRNGKLELGHINGSKKAELEIGDGSLLMIDADYGQLIINTGSKLKIRSGGTLFIRENSNVILKGTSSIEVESGAFICIEDGANITLQDPSSLINISGDAISGLNPQLLIQSSTCFGPCNYPFTGNGAIICECEELPVFTHEDNLVMSSSTTIVNGNFVLKKDMIIESGVTANFINSQIALTEIGKIIIKQGGKLIIDGTTITKTCNDLWVGIQVWGNSNARQISQYQGTIELKNNAVIEHAKNAISTWDGSDYNTSGGIIKASNSTFRNNLRSIEFMSYSNHNTSGIEISNVSYFTKCTFTINNDNLFSQHGYTFANHVTMWDVNKIPFKGCNFKNETSFSPNSTNRGKGIYTASAGFIVTEECPGFYDIQTCTCLETPIRSTFQGLYYGVFATNSGSNYSFTISESNFTNNYCSIYNEGVNNCFITKSNFDISTYGNYPNSYPNGIYLNSCSGFTVEENNMYSIYSSLPSGFQPRGISATSIGIAENIIYRNNFQNLMYGILCWGVCGENTPNGTGLQFQCNQFESVDRNIFKYSGPIKSWQGIPSRGADNNFSFNPNMTFYSAYSSQSNIVYHYSNTGSHDPLSPPKISANITKYNTANTNSCASTLCDFPVVFMPKSIAPGGSNDAYDLTTYEELKSQYETLITDFHNSGYDNLSLDDLNNANSEITIAANIMLEEINSISRLMADISDRKISELLMDSIMYTTELRNWYEVVDKPISKYSLVNDFCSYGEYDLARSLLLDIPNMFEFDTNEFIEYYNFNELFLLRENVHLSDRNWNQLTQEEITLLESIRTATDGFSSAIANSILCFFYNNCLDLIDEEPLPNLKKGQGTNNQKRTINNDINNSAFVYPNLANDKLNIVLNFDVDKAYNITIIDISGRKVFESDINSNESSLNISSLSSGVYYYIIGNDVHEISKGKFIKN